MEKSIHCTAYNGRYLMMGFASNKSVVDEKFIIPRRLCTGNLRFCGVLLAYANAAMTPLMKKGMGWNFIPEAIGEAIAGKIAEQVVAQEIKPVIGRVVDFEDLPVALEALRDRDTVGRTIVKLY
jgi:NADPH:quinone reductase-like Zn-dependent oxidoreductase